MKAGSERYQNAVKGITNLLTIIDQARANKLKAQNDLAKYTQAYNDALKAQKDAQNLIIGAEIKIKQIQSALAGANAKASDLAGRIAALTQLGDDLIRDKNDILGRINDQESKRANLMAKLKDTNTKLGGLVDDLRTQQEQCQIIGTDLANTNDDITKKQQDLANITQNRLATEKDVLAKQKLVDDLRAKLDAAEGDLAGAKIKLAGLKNDEITLPGVINDLQKRINAIVESSKTCTAKTDALKNSVNKLQNTDAAGLTDDINGIDGALLDLRGQSAGIDKALAKNQQDVETIKAGLSDATNAVAFLKNQSVQADNDLRNAYSQGNDANTKVNFAKQNLGAVNKRWED